MTEQFPETEKWLTLSEAARHLSIHPTTLRRWANNGDIPVMITPGGHRRFALSDIRQFANRRRSQKLPVLARTLARQAIAQTRQGIVALGDDSSWLNMPDELTRERFRLLGRQLMGLTLQYISDTEGNGNILQEARGIGREYGTISRAKGLPLVDALQAAMFFRDTLVETAVQLPETTRIQPEANVRLLQRINRITNVVYLGVAEAYDDTHT